MDLRRWVPAKMDRREIRIHRKATSDMQGQFSSSRSSLVMDYYQLMVSGMTPMVVIMDSTMHVHIKAEIPDGGFIADATITGSKAASEVHEYYAKAMPLQPHSACCGDDAAHEGRRNAGASDRAAQKKIEADSWAKQFIQEHPGSPALSDHWSTSSHGPMPLFAEVLELLKRS